MSFLLKKLELKNRFQISDSNNIQALWYENQTEINNLIMTKDLKFPYYYNDIVSVTFNYRTIMIRKAT